MNLINKKQFGSVSLFVVVFSALLITIVTVGFTRIMIQDQQQATATDLSQSAYDSAQVGVEDAKRVLLRYQSICNEKSSSECATAATNVSSNVCNVAVGALTGVTAGVDEIKVQTGSTVNKLDQAYTCVKIKLETDNYLGTLSANETNIIPLTSVGIFNQIRIKWFNEKDLQTLSNTIVDVPSSALGKPLLSMSSWESTSNRNKPAIIRAQMIQFGSTFSLTDFDSNSSMNSNSNTLFLYPSNINESSSFISDSRRNSSTRPIFSACLNNINIGGYACSSTIDLPEPINSGNRTIFLRLSSLYKNSNYEVSLFNNSTRVNFNAVQPEIDSTGRANNLFRRVTTRVELTDVNFPYPEMAVDLNGNFCKDFLITSDSNDYDNKCTP